MQDVAVIAAFYKAIEQRLRERGAGPLPPNWLTDFFNGSVYWQEVFDRTSARERDEYVAEKLRESLGHLDRLFPIHTRTQELTQELGFRELPLRTDEHVRLKRYVRDGWYEDDADLRKRCKISALRAMASTNV